jgi:hypothetical protein
MAGNEDPDDDVLLDSDEATDASVEPFEDDEPAPGPWPEFSSVFVLRARQPFEDWVRQLPDHDETTLAPIDLILAFATPELPTQADADRWLEEHYEDMFERWLAPWAEKADWPAGRSYEMFRAWFDIVFSPAVEDMTDGGADEGADYEGAPPEVACAPLSLREVRDRFLELPDDGSLHVDIESGELFAFTDDALDALESTTADDLEVSDDELDVLQDAFDSGTIVTIAHRRQLPVVDLMHDFTEQMEPGTFRNRLLNALQGRRAERRFNDAIDMTGLRARWDRWFQRAVAGLMVVSLAGLGIPNVDDLEPEDPQSRRTDS